MRVYMLICKLVSLLSRSSGTGECRGDTSAQDSNQLTLLAAELKDHEWILRSVSEELIDLRSRLRRLEQELF